MRVPRQPEYHRPDEPGAEPDRWARVRAVARWWRERGWWRWVALGLAVVLLATAGAGWAMLHRLEGNLVTDVTTAEELTRYEEERPPPAPGAARNVLLIGTDSRNGRGEGGSQRSDAVILLHLAGDRESATAVSIPRDLLVDIPRCTRTGRDPVEARSQAPARRAQFNWAFETGGAACTIRTLERMTEIRVDHHVIVDFAGFERLVDAVGGVEVCFDQPLRDRPARLDLPAGRQTLDGEEALAFVRARKEIGDGSDTARIARQQEFLGALARKVSEGGMLVNPAKLFPVLDATTSSITTDTRLDSLVKLYDLLRKVRDVPTDRFHFLTVPRVGDPEDVNRDVLRQPAANQLFKRLREDRPAGSGPGGAERGDDGNGGPPHHGPLAGNVCK
jgi:LCP family protein required for cell wall assembly